MNAAVWELTRGEFALEVLAGRRDFPLLGNSGTAARLARSVHWAEKTGQNSDIAREAFDKAILQHHCAEVLIAYADGMTVPKHFLREYADYFSPEQQLGGS